jgi:hypothetical protein
MVQFVRANMFVCTFIFEGLKGPQYPRALRAPRGTRVYIREQEIEKCRQKVAYLVA